MGMVAILVNGPRLFFTIFRSTWSLNNIGPEVSEEKSFEILNIFPTQMYGPIQMNREANLTSP